MRGWHFEKQTLFLKFALIAVFTWDWRRNNRLRYPDSRQGLMEYGSVHPLTPHASILSRVNCRFCTDAHLCPREGGKTVPPNRGRPIRRGLQSTSCRPICRTLDSISFSSPRRYIDWRTSIYLFICLPVCGPKVWWNSERSAIYVGIIIWKCYSQATVLLRSRQPANWRRWSDWQRRE